jgi:hypothetical protein
MMTGNLPVVPTRASLSASGRAAAASTIHNDTSQHFFGTQSTSHTESFQQQTAHVQQSMQQSHFSPVAAGARTTGPGSTESRSASAAGFGKPSAGTTTANENGSRGSTEPMSSVNRGEQTSSTRGEPNRGEWKTFTPPSRSSDSAGRAASAAETLRGDGGGTYWNRTAPSSSYSRESGSSNYDRGATSRPQLNMRQPIAQPRSSGSYGGYRGAPSYGGGHGGYSGGASHSAPSSGGGSHSSGSGHSGGGGHH